MGGTVAALRKVFGGQMPDITPAQVIGAIAAAAGPVCRLAGIDLSAEQLGAIDDLKVIGLGLIGADAALRIGRNVKEGKVRAAALAPTGPQPVPPGATGPIAVAPALEGLGNGVPVEAPLDPAEIDELTGEVDGLDDEVEASGDDAGVADLDDEARAIEAEELTGVAEDERP